MNTLGDRLHDARKEKGYTQSALAQAIGVSRGVIYNLEKGKTEPQAIVINALCQTLNINPDWLLRGVGEREETRQVSQSARVLAELYEVAKGLSEEQQLYLLDTVKALKRRLGGQDPEDHG